MSRQTECYRKSAFSEWLSKYGPAWFEGHTDIQDIDFIIFNYLTGDILTLEVKEFENSTQQAQNDTQNIIKQLLSLSSGKIVNTLRGKRPIIYHGHHLIQFLHTTPDDGSTMLDGQPIGKYALIKFLNFGKEV